MADLEAEVAAAAARAPPVAPPPPTPRTAAPELKAAVADFIIFCFASAVSVGYAASIALVVARYAVGGGFSYAVYAVVDGARVVFLLALYAVLLLCPYTILLLILRLDTRQPEPLEAALVIEGVRITVRVPDLEHPGVRGWRHGSGCGIVPLLIFVVFLMCMLLGLLLQERWPAKGCSVQTVGASALISDIGSFVCSVMVIVVFVPLVLVQMRNIPR